MSVPNITLVIPGLNWNQDWKQQNLLSYFNTNWIDQFYLKGCKKKAPSAYSELLSEYLLDESLLDKTKNRLNLVNKRGIFVSPVFQNMRLHQMSVLCGNEILAISREEAEVLCEGLNQLYQAEQYSFQVIAPDLWLLQTSDAMEFNSPCAYDFIDLLDEEVRAVGKDGDKIQRLQAEIQMFLHNSDVNRKRRQNAQFELNGVWFWHDLQSRIKYPNRDLMIMGENIAWLRPEAVVKEEGLLSEVENAIAIQHSLVLFLDVLNTPNLLLNFESYGQRFVWLGEKVVKPLFDMQKNYLINTIELVSNGNTGGTINLKRRPWWSLFRKVPYRGNWID